MTAGIRTWATTALLLALSGAAMAEPDPQRIGQTEQAALVNARKALVAKLGEVRLTSTAAVADCTADDGRILADVQAFAAKLRPAGKPRWFADGSCEVDLETKLTDFLTAFRASFVRHYRGKEVKPADIDAKIADAGDRVIRVVGSAVLNRPERPDADVPPIWSHYSTAEGRAAATGAALADARRKLLRRIRTLDVTKGVTAGNLMAANDEIRTGLKTFVGQLPTGRPSYRPNELIVDVIIEAEVSDIAEQLKRLYLAHGTGDAARPTDFDRLGAQHTKPIRVTGNGAPPEPLTSRAPAITPPALRRPEWPPMLRAVGAALVEPSAQSQGQAKLRALRSAEQAARTKLAEQTDGLRITATATVKQLIAAAGSGARKDIQTYLSGARITRSEVTDKGQAEAAAEISTDRLWKIVQFWHQRGPDNRAER
jgi:hypothetical protein